MHMIRFVSKLRVYDFIRRTEILSFIGHFKSNALHFRGGSWRDFCLSTMDT